MHGLPQAERIWIHHHDDRSDLEGSVRAEREILPQEREAQSSLKSPRYAEDLNFWKSGKSSPDAWIDRTKKQIISLGGSGIAEGFGADGTGRSAFMIGFTLQEERFSIVWPVMQSRCKDERAERIQAATTLYHYVKAVSLYSVVVGARSAFFSHLLLSDGRTANQVATPELLDRLPKLLAGRAA